MNTLPAGLLRGAPGMTTGPSTLLARRSISQRVAAPGWPLLQGKGGRPLLVHRLRAALLHDSPRDRWPEDGWTAAACEPASAQ